MIHLRIVSPTACSDAVLETLEGNRSVCNVIHLQGVARDPEGDLFLADVAREDASIVLADLKHLGVGRDGSIAITDVEAYVSDRAEAAVEHAQGAPSDAVVWEEVEAQTDEQIELSASFLGFMVLSAVLCAIAIFQDSPVLLVGAMVVGPEFGPIAGFCVAIATRRIDVARRSGLALLAGFPLAIAATLLLALVLRATGLTPDQFDGRDSSLSDLISHPDLFAFIVAASAGAAGVLSLSTAKSGAVIGVLVSVTTLPAASNVGIAIAYSDGDALAGSAGQLALNLVAILVSGTTVLTLQRAHYARRRAKHLRDDAIPRQRPAA